MTFAWKTMIATTIAVNAVALTMLVDMPTKLVWNTSASVPTGFYALRPTGPLRRDQLVAVSPSPALENWLVARGYLGRRVPLIKHVAALPGETVCRDGAVITLSGSAVATARERDRIGRPLPVWRGCRTLADGEVLLLNPASADSMDGRYFGPVAASSIVGRAVPLWTGDGA